MTAVVDASDTKRTVAIWFLAALLWALRVTSGPMVLFGLLFALYGLFGLLVFDRIEPAWMTGIGCTGMVWLLTRCCRESASGSRE
jgi:hypothetical protein